MSGPDTSSPDRSAVRRHRQSWLKLAFSGVGVIALVLGLINDTLGVKSAVFGPDSGSPNASSDTSLRPDPNTIGRNLSIENRIDYQSTMGIEDDGTVNPTTIRWNPTFLISNENTIPLSIKDIDIHFPEQRTEDGDSVRLVKNASEGIIVYQDVRDYLGVKSIRDPLKRSNEEGSRSPSRVVIPAGGGERILEFKHLYALEVGGEPVRFTGDTDENFILWMGQYLDLERGPGSSYRCGAKRLDVTIRTYNEEIKKEVGVILLPVGCKLRIPPGRSDQSGG